MGAPVAAGGPALGPLLALLLLGAAGAARHGLQGKAATGPGPGAAAGRPRRGEADGATGGRRRLELPPLAAPVPVPFSGPGPLTAALFALGGLAAGLRAAGDRGTFIPGAPGAGSARGQLGAGSRRSRCWLGVSGGSRGRGARLGLAPAPGLLPVRPVRLHGAGGQP